MLGVMIDCSRNAVMNVKALKNYIDLLHKMGYDTLMLYTEDTYEVNNEPYFGFMRGRYTKSEMKEIDAYCISKGIELIPCIQTLAHLNCIFKASEEYDAIKDCDDILLIDDERTYTLLENIFSTLSECFTSRNVHIGMDEADKVGLGKYLSKHGYSDRFTIINNHLHKVCDLAAKYDLKPMIWSDMFCRLATASDDYWASEGVDLSQIAEKAALPENISLVYWDYYSTDYDRYVNMIRLNKAFNRPVLFAGGAWTWEGFMANNNYAIESTEVALKACADESVGDVFTTLWGDDGGETSRLCALPTLFYMAEVYHGNRDMEDIKQKFQDFIGVSWNDFVNLKKIDAIGGDHGNDCAKRMLYNDLFMGLYDCHIRMEDGKYYEKLYEEFSKIHVDNEYRNIFATMKAVADVLAVKATLGLQIRSAYQSGDKECLKKLAEQDCEAVLERIETLYQVFKVQWFAENKPHGFDIQDIRFGALKQRVRSCQNRMLEYIEGNIANIPELEDTLLEKTGKAQWLNIVSPNVVSFGH